MLKKVGLAVSKQRLTPKDFDKAHDHVMDLVSIFDNQVYDKAIHKQYQEKATLMCGYIGGFHFLIPKSVAELFRESRVLKHCVKRYAEDVANGDTMIVFVRENIDEPFFTMEIQNGAIVQLFGLKHNKPNESIKEAASKYMNEISKNCLQGRRKVG